jgi:hypothetical protein
MYLRDKNRVSHRSLPAAASHIIRLLAHVSSTHLPRHLLHLLPSSSRFIDATIRSTPSLSDKFRLQALPGSSASKTPLLVFDTPALFCLTCQTLDLVGGLCNARGVGHRRLAQTPCESLAVSSMIRRQDFRGMSRNSRQHLIASLLTRPRTPTTHGKISTCHPWRSSRFCTQCNNVISCYFLVICMYQ